MGIIQEVINEQKIPRISKKKKEELEEALATAMMALIEKSITHGYHAGKGQPVEETLRYLRRTFVTNI